MKKGLQLDDAFLAFAMLTLTGATVLLYKGTSAMYAAQAVLLNPLSAANMPNLLNEIVFFQQVNWSVLSLTWGTIFTVKLAFLHLFRQLICRMPAMIRWWWVVCVATFLSFVFCFSDTFLSCSKMGMAAGKPPHTHLFSIFAEQS